MTQQRHLLPFPVSDAADLRRAIRYVTKHDDTEASRRYVMSRAKALGHLDLIPSHWNEAHPPRGGSRDSLERQFVEQSHRHGVSVARLKCVYFRGIEDFQHNGVEIGSASMWGLVRVQRYINAMKTGDVSMTDDVDLCFSGSPAAEERFDYGIELNVNSGAILTDVIYGNGSGLAQIFHPGVADTMVMDGTKLEVFGHLDQEQWKYELDTQTGEHNLAFMSA